MSQQQADAKHALDTAIAEENAAMEQVGKALRALESARKHLSESREKTRSGGRTTGRWKASTATPSSTPSWFPAWSSCPSSRPWWKSVRTERTAAGLRGSGDDETPIPDRLNRHRAMNTYSAILISLLVALPAAKAAAEGLDSADPSQVQSTDAEGAAKAMFEAYRYGGPQEMQRVEEQCWVSIKAAGAPTDDGVARCSLMGMAGAFVEASYARQQRRSPSPSYTGQGIRERIMSRTKGMGWGQERTQSVLVSSVSSRQGEVITGLMNAGMR